MAATQISQTFKKRRRRRKRSWVPGLVLSRSRLLATASGRMGPSPSPSLTPSVRLTATRRSWSRSWSCPSSSSAARSFLASPRRRRRRTRRTRRRRRRRRRRKRRRSQGQAVLPETPAHLSRRRWGWAVTVVSLEDLARVPCLQSPAGLGTAWKTCLD